MNKNFKKLFLLMAVVVMTMMCFAFSGTKASAASLVWPVPGHKSLSRGFFIEPTYSHYGIDITDDSIRGAFVVSALGGYVVEKYTCNLNHYPNFPSCCYGFGNGIVIRGDDGRYYQYAHMLEGSIPDDVYVGAYVAAGNKVGRVGNTGNSHGDHLHFQMSTGLPMNNSAINPQNESFMDSTVNPRGVVDECKGGEGNVFVRGWSYDDDDLSKALNIHVYIGEERHAYIYADKLRADVNNVYGCGNYHGFSETIKTELTGTQAVRVYAINWGGQINHLIYSGTVNITPAPKNPCANGHTGGTATCKEKAKCSICGIFYGSLASHSYKAATCTTPKTCRVCKVTTGKALGHKYSNACDTKCNTCSAKRSITHTYKTTTTKATLSKNGKQVTKCTVCGNVKSTTTVYYPKTIKLSATSYVYNGKKKTPSVTVKDSKGNKLKKNTDYTVKYSSGRKNTGKYTVTVTFKGKYSGIKKLTFSIVPAKVTLSKVTAGSKSAAVAWKTTTGASGYQVQYSTSSKFKSAKTATVSKGSSKKTTIKKLTKGKKYYFKVRAYKTVNDTKVYGAWSSVKSVKVK